MLVHALINIHKPFKKDVPSLISAPPEGLDYTRRNKPNTQNTHLTTYQVRLISPRREVQFITGVIIRSERPAVPTRLGHVQGCTPFRGLDAAHGFRCEVPERVKLKFSVKMSGLSV